MLYSDQGTNSSFFGTIHCLSYDLKFYARFWTTKLILTLDICEYWLSVLYDVFCDVYSAGRFWPYLHVWYTNTRVTVLTIILRIIILLVAFVFCNTLLKTWSRTEVQVCLDNKLKIRFTRQERRRAESGARSVLLPTSGGPPHRAQRKKLLTQAYG